ncbi:MAG: transketolase [Candidatus Margulisiibacteriota bacterium]
MQSKIRDLENKAKIIRRRVLETVAATRLGHLGGTFSCTDILVALYYGRLLRFDPQNQKWEDRDRFVIGKGHACLALYHIWVDLGMLPASRLEGYGRNDSSLGGQLNIDTPGAEYNTGSLGHALGIGAGMALAARMDKKDYRSIVLIGDGECAEGSIWESIMFISQHKLTNFIGIIDRNRLGVTDVVEEDDGTGRMDDKIRACGWEVKKINGHSFEDIFDVFQNAGQLERPLMIIADTVKGKGVSFMENGVKWHYSIPKPEELEIARKELAVRQ